MIVKSDDNPQYEMGQYRSYENTILLPHIYIYIILYVNTGKMFSGVCISNVTSVRDVYMSSFYLFCMF